ncbi:aldehyde dehydrogenase family protein [Psychromonas hadalis]|uniref:aldehyde dehydrogenase family protein n=1 Tax=Psychromonas hadalis TaxID=211669 RepID=UPI0003B31F1A|nr:aldehyde dehydrogenase family protein [Psychromonas hadalis]
MLNSTQKILNDALQVWPSWNDLQLNQRGQLLQAWARSFDKQQTIDSLATQMVNFQVKQGQTLIAETIEMPGPTGETNELTTAGRGIFVIAAPQEVPVTAIVGLISAALISGNVVILSLCAQQQSIANDLCTSLHKIGVDNAIASVIESDELLPLIESPRIAGVALMGNRAEVLEINKCLAMRPGQIAQLIAETDLENLPTITDNYLLYRFITEKTQTVNITAVGGNATLLALGCGDQ